MLARVQGDDPVFEDTELPIGKVGPGETKAFTAQLSIPKDALDRVNRLGLEVKNALWHNHAHSNKKYHRNTECDRLHHT